MIKFRIDYLNFSTVVIKLYKAIELVEKIFEFDILNKKENDSIVKLPGLAKSEELSIVWLDSDQK